VMHRISLDPLPRAPALLYCWRARFSFPAVLHDTQAIVPKHVLCRACCFSLLLASEPSPALVLAPHSRFEVDSGLHAKLGPMVKAPSIGKMHN